MLSIERTDCIAVVDAFALCAADGEDGCCPPDIIVQLRDGYGLGVVVAFSPLAGETRKSGSSGCRRGSGRSSLLRTQSRSMLIGDSSRSVQSASSMLSVARSSNNVFLIFFSFCFIFEACTMSASRTLVFVRPNHLIMSLPAPSSSVYVVLSLFYYLIINSLQCTMQRMIKDRARTLLDCRC